MHTGHSGIKSHADNIQIVTIIGNELFLRHPTYRLDLIADAGGFFKFKRLAGLFHPGNQLRQYLIVFPGEKQPHVFYLLLVLFFTYQSGNARS